MNFVQCEASASVGVEFLEGRLHEFKILRFADAATAVGVDVVEVFPGEFDPGLRGVRPRGQCKRTECADQYQLEPCVHYCCSALVFNDAACILTAWMLFAAPGLPACCPKQGVFKCAILRCVDILCLQNTGLAETAGISKDQTRDGAVWQLVGLITRRSQVQILLPQPALQAGAPRGVAGFCFGSPYRAFFKAGPAQCRSQLCAVTALPSLSRFCLQAARHPIPTRIQAARAPALRAPAPNARTTPTGAFTRAVTRRVNGPTQKPRPSV